MRRSPLQSAGHSPHSWLLTFWKIIQQMVVQSNRHKQTLQLEEEKKPVIEERDNSFISEVVINQRHIQAHNMSDHLAFGVKSILSREFRSQKQELPATRERLKLHSPSSIFNPTSLPWSSPDGSISSSSVSSSSVSSNSPARSVEGTPPPHMATPVYAPMAILPQYYTAPAFPPERQVLCFHISPSERTVRCFHTSRYRSCRHPLTSWSVSNRWLHFRQLLFCRHPVIRSTHSALVILRSIRPTASRELPSRIISWRPWRRPTKSANISTSSRGRMSPNPWNWLKPRWRSGSRTAGPRRSASTSRPSSTRPWKIKKRSQISWNVIHLSAGENSWSPNLKVNQESIDFFIHLQCKSIKKNLKKEREK